MCLTVTKVKFCLFSCVVWLLLVSLLFCPSTCPRVRSRGLLPGVTGWVAHECLRELEQSPERGPVDGAEVLVDLPRGEPPPERLRLVSVVAGVEVPRELDREEYKAFP